MNVDVPPWVTHEGQSIYSVHIDATGKRAVTTGSDSKVKIWSLPPLISASAELQENSHPRLLALLAEHNNPVNTARFSPTGKVLATCSDDGLVNLYELHPGPGRAVFGEKANLENWKQSATLRGHSNSVVVNLDLDWAPDGERLATCSLENSISIWTTSGKQLATLEAHTSLVKGLAWDPIGTYLASQSDDKSVKIWRCSDWRLVKTVTAPFQFGGYSSTFCLRLAWSPDGQYITAVNSFQPPKHAAFNIERGSWESDISINGHHGPVTVVAYNPLLFQNSDQDDPSYCFALGAQDRKVTVWLSDRGRPAVVLTKMFTQSVADLAWSPDGHTLLICSTDGQLAVVTFQEGSLGKPLTKAAQKARIQVLYGPQSAAKRILLEDASLLKDADERDNRNRGTEPSTSAAIPHPPLALSSDHAVQLQNGPQHQLQSVPSLPAPKPSEISQNMQSRMGPPPSKLPVQEAAVVDGASRKRPLEQSSELARNVAPRRLAPQPLPTSPPVHSGQQAPLGQHPGTQTRQILHITQTAPRAINLALGKDDLPGTTDETILGIVNTGTTATLLCKQGSNIIWKDQVKGSICKAAGNLNFSAVVTLDGSLYIYSAAGRRVLPRIALAAAPNFLCAGREGWALMAVSLVTGMLKLWDVEHKHLTCNASLQSLQSGQVLGARLSESDCPLIFMMDGTAFALHPTLEEWMTVVDPGFASSAFVSQFPAASRHPAELARIEQEASSTPGRQPGNLASLGNTNRRHLESQMAAALALGSAQEYKNWLLTYVRHIAGEGEESSLREVCNDLLGPVRLTAKAEWQSKVLGWEKRSLLKEVLQEISRHRSQQRLIAEFKELLQAASTP